MKNELKIATWNCCLGLFHKLCYLKQELLITKIDILFVQEAEIDTNVDPTFYEIDNYNLHFDQTRQSKVRIAAYVKKSLRYTAQTWSSCELVNIVIEKTNIFGVYRPFKLVNSSSDYVDTLIQNIRDSSRKERTIITGDINFDFNKVADKNTTITNFSKNG